MSNENVVCPACGESFIDMRGLTSHARHKHNMSSDQLAEKLEEKKNGTEYVNHTIWKILGGIGIAALTLLAIKKLR